MDIERLGVNITPSLNIANMANRWRGFILKMTTKLQGWMWNSLGVNMAPSLKLYSTLHMAKSLAGRQGWMYTTLGVNMTPF